MPAHVPYDPAALIERLAVHADPAGPRHMVGIAGAPGAGKSTLALQLVRQLGEKRAALVPMDGFHLDDQVLQALGRRDRKGAIDTFDADGYLSLLRRLHAREEPVTYGPEFRRESELAVAGAIGVPATCPLVVTEGNYLLADQGPWPSVRALLDEVWFVDPGEQVRVDRLIARHRMHGRSEEDARRWALTVDAANAELIAAGRERADLIIGPPED